MTDSDNREGRDNMDLLVPLNRLIFGHAEGTGINARTTGRDEGIAELAANLHARGQIENLIVMRVSEQHEPGDPCYAVSNGNRRLAAFRMIHGEQSGHPIRCTLRDVDHDGAFEDSLTTAVTARQLHPVDQYEAFARLRDRGGKSVEEIARHYGMTVRQVEQALALGHLSDGVRAAWRKGEIKAEVAKAFTLAADHAAQDELIERLRRDRDLGDMDDYEVKAALRIDDVAGRLVEFIGVEAYVARGGKVTLDLFGCDHRVSDLKLAKAMANEKLAAECARLKAAGWSFAVTRESLGGKHWEYRDLLRDEQKRPTEDEERRLDELRAVFHEPGDGGARPLKELSAAELEAAMAWRRLTEEIELRAYTPAMMAKAGCILQIDSDGQLDIEYGKVKPAQREAAAEVVKTEQKAAKKAASKEAVDAVAAGREAAESTELSSALKERLDRQLISATREALAAMPQDEEFVGVLARCIISMITPERPFSMPDQVRTKLPTIRQALQPDLFNTAIAQAFDATDYFATAPKPLVLKAIAEAINPDEARKALALTRAKLGEFALANLGKSGWLPKELRTVHYAFKPLSVALTSPSPALAGEGRGGGARPAKTARGRPHPNPPPQAGEGAQRSSRRSAAAKPKAKAARPVKRAAAKKIGAKKRKA